MAENLTTEQCAVILERVWQVCQMAPLPRVGPMTHDSIGADLRLLAVELGVPVAPEGQPVAPRQERRRAARAEAKQKPPVASKATVNGK